MDLSANAETVSRARLSCLLGGDEAGAREVLELFLNEIPRFQRAFESVATAPQFARVVHRLRGSLLSLGLHSIAGRLGAIELQAQDSLVLDQAALVWIVALLPALADETKQALGGADLSRTPPRP